MIADQDLHVWLETSSNAGQVIVVPYAKSARDAQLNFRMSMFCSGAAGTSRVTQQGRLSASAGEAAPLARLNVGSLDQRKCEIEISLREDGEVSAAYVFDVRSP